MLAFRDLSPPSAPFSGSKIDSRSHIRGIFGNSCRNVWNSRSAIPTVAAINSNSIAGGDRVFLILKRKMNSSRAQSRAIRGSRIIFTDYLKRIIDMGIYITRATVFVRISFVVTTRTSYCASDVPIG